MTKWNVVIIEPGYTHYDIEQSILSEVGAQVLPQSACPSAKDKAALLDKADAIMVRETRVSAELIDKMPNLKGIARYGVGYDNIDCEYAKTKRIPVSNVPDYGANESVSEFAVGLMIAASRCIVSRDKALHQGNWSLLKQGPIHQLKGRTLGIVGFGLTGRGFAEKVKGLGFAKLLVCDPYINASICKEYNAESVTIDELCRQSTVISLHTPLTPETRHLINTDRLALMDPTTILVNTARGAVVDGVALYHALVQKKIFAAALDTHETEPFSPDYPLLTLDNCIITDHIAWYTVEAAENMQRGAAKEVLRMLKSEKPINWVNPW